MAKSHYQWAFDCYPVQKKLPTSWWTSTVLTGMLIDIFAYVNKCDESETTKIYFLNWSIIDVKNPVSYKCTL